MLRDKVNEKIKEYRDCSDRINEIGTKELLRQVTSSNENFGGSMHGNPPFILNLNDIRAVVIDGEGNGYLLNPFAPGVEQWVDTSEMVAVYTTPLLDYGLLVFEPAMDIEYLPVIESYDDLNPPAYLETLEAAVASRLREKLEKVDPDIEEKHVLEAIEGINDALLDIYMDAVEKYKNDGKESLNDVLEYVERIQFRDSEEDEPESEEFEAIEDEYVIEMEDQDDREIEKIYAVADKNKPIVITISSFLEKQFEALEWDSTICIQVEGESGTGIDSVVEELYEELLDEELDDWLGGLNIDEVKVSKSLTLREWITENLEKWTKLAADHKSEVENREE